MITRKDLAPLDDTLREFWRSRLKYLKTKHYGLYIFPVKISLLGAVLVVM